MFGNESPRLRDGDAWKPANIRVESSRAAKTCGMP
jgi:hypothetical protein